MLQIGKLWDREMKRLVVDLTGTSDRPEIDPGCPPPSIVMRRHHSGRTRAWHTRAVFPGMAIERISGNRVGKWRGTASESQILGQRDLAHAKAILYHFYQLQHSTALFQKHSER